MSQNGAQGLHLVAQSALRGLRIARSMREQGPLYVLLDCFGYRVSRINTQWALAQLQQTCAPGGFARF